MIKKVQKMDTISNDIWYKWPDGDQNCGRNI
jgi:hypothetical protein